ncbi:hypothetical protein Tco_0421369 [Tanacetum coccineum]
MGASVGIGALSKEVEDDKLLNFLNISLIIALISELLVLRVESVTLISESALSVLINHVHLLKKGGAFNVSSLILDFNELHNIVDGRTKSSRSLKAKELDVEDSESEGSRDSSGFLDFLDFFDLLFFFD